MSDLATRITELRTNKGLTKRQLANDVRVNPSMIFHLERGERKPGVELAIRLAARFDMPLTEFMGDDMPADWRALLEAAEVTA